MDKAVTMNKVEQLISAIDNKLIPQASDIEKLGPVTLELKALAVQIRQQIRKA